jgi:hypothetical protein
VKVSRERKRLMNRANAYSRLAAKAFRSGDMRSWERHSQTANRIKDKALRA